MEETATPWSGREAGAASQVPMRWVSAAATDVGKVRRVNEDALLDHPEIGLWVVADGVGGAAAGDKASALIVESLGRLSMPASGTAFLAAVRAELHATNGALRREAAIGGHRVIASTVVALLFFGQHFACVWAGDSRLYLWRDRRLQQVSHDHSEVQELVDQGMLDPADARHHPRGNVVTRAVGAHDELLLDTVHGPACTDDVFLLCTDGLSKPLEDDEIAALLDQPIERAVAALIQASLERGAPDNVTVVAVQIVGPAAEPS